MHVWLLSLHVHACVCGYARISPCTGSFAGIQSCGCQYHACSAAGVAKYRITFNAEWQQPLPHPTFPHWSRLVGASHSPCAVLWRNGTQATEGVRAVAEWGGTSQIQSEIRALGDHVRDSVRFHGISTAAGSVTQLVSVDHHRPMVSLVSMIAPSPDWIVGVDSYSLCVGNQWIPNATYDLHLWDAGTDSGKRFQSRNAATHPRQPITRITATTSHLSESMAGVHRRLGQMIFRRVSVTAEHDTHHVSCPACSHDSRCVPSADITNSKIDLPCAQNCLKLTKQAMPLLYVMGPIPELSS